MTHQLQNSTVSTRTLFRQPTFSTKTIPRKANHTNTGSHTKKTFPASACGLEPNRKWNDECEKQRSRGRSRTVQNLDKPHTCPNRGKCRQCRGTVYKSPNVIVAIKSFTDWSVAMLIHDIEAVHVRRRRYGVIRGIDDFWTCLLKFTFSVYTFNINVA